MKGPACCGHSTPPQRHTRRSRPRTGTAPADQLPQGCSGRAAGAQARTPVCGAHRPHFAVVHALCFPHVLPHLRQTATERVPCVSPGQDRAASAASGAHPAPFQVQLYSAAALPRRRTWSMCRALKILRTPCLCSLVFRPLLCVFLLLPDGMAAGQVRRRAGSELQGGEGGGGGGVLRHAACLRPAPRGMHSARPAAQLGGVGSCPCVAMVPRPPTFSSKPALPVSVVRLGTELAYSGIHAAPPPPDPHAAAARCGERCRHAVVSRADMGSLPTSNKWLEPPWLLHARALVLCGVTAAATAPCHGSCMHFAPPDSLQRSIQARSRDIVRHEIVAERIPNPYGTWRE